MDQSQLPHLLGFGTPAVYRIVVQGQLDPCIVTDIADARIEAGDQHTTRLLVRVMDQADLNGVLDSIYRFHLPILSVQLIRKSCNRGE
ncbi:MAG: hypothetical protein R3F53_18410 [Gammaproteobacteria bacterium]